jgi:type IV pilus assembly protein PilX
MKNATKIIAIQANNTTARGRFTSIKNEKGITLIMVLIFMVTLSLVAAVGMRGVITGDKAVANERDRALSFQAAESASREGIADILKINAAVNPRTTTYPPTLPLGGNAEHWRTTSNLTEADCKDPIPLTDAATKRYKWDKNKDAANPNCSVEATSTFGNAVKPRYFIELMPGVAISATQADCWYRVTSRATGGTQEADVILQVMVSNTINGVPGDCK